MVSIDVLIDDARIASIAKVDDAGLRLVYEDGWRSGADGFPLSFSLPLAPPSVEGEPVRAFLRNLLPDDGDMLRMLAGSHGNVPTDILNLLGAAGRDCAGAVRFAPSGVDIASEPDGIDPLDEREIASRLRNLKERRIALDHRPTDRSSPLVAGAQPKMALRLEDGGWGVPYGREATTHILKPPIPGFPGVVENEHACLRLAARLGLYAARSQVVRFEDEIAIVVERYDRVRNLDGTVGRVHQEDLTQALSVDPAGKYQREGGPSAEAVARVLDAVDEPVAAKNAFASALVLNFLICGTDAHAKNHSIMHRPGGSSRLAPLYDVISFAPYVAHPSDVSRLKMAQKIGGKYVVSDVMPRHWEKQAELMGMDPGRMVDSVASMADRLPDELASVLAECRDEGAFHPALDVMADRIAERCRKVSALHSGYGLSPTAPGF